MSEILWHMYQRIYAKYPLFLSEFNETWIFSTDFRNILIYHVSWKSVPWKPRQAFWTDLQKLIVAFCNLRTRLIKAQSLQKVTPCTSSDGWFHVCCVCNSNSGSNFLQWSVTSNGWRIWIYMHHRFCLVTTTTAGMCAFLNWSQTVRHLHLSGGFTIRFSDHNSYSCLSFCPCCGHWHGNS
jgi:hypothetical protein